MRIEYHRTLIADTVRNDAFHAALQALIVPGQSVVADIGAGTGLLGLMAAKLGARAVYLYETAEVAHVAEKILKANKARNCHLMPCHSTEFQDPPRVDIVVSETLGNYAFEEDMITTLNDARRRFLKPGGTILPSRVTQYICPVIAPRLDAELRAWERVGRGIDLGIAQTMSLNNAYVRTLAVTELLDKGAAAQAWDSVDFAKEARSNRKGEVTWRLASPATIFGFAYWWTADLAPGITLSTAPGAPRTHWEQLYFPLLSPITGKAGERILATLRSSTSAVEGTHLAWASVHQDVKGRTISRQALDLNKGFLP